MSFDVKIAVCDDEVYFQDRIKELLQKYFKENGLAVSIDLYESGAAFCSNPDNFKAYDVVFLDIEMGEMNGMYGYHFTEKEKDYSKNGISLCGREKTGSAGRYFIYRKPFAPVVV